MAIRILNMENSYFFAIYSQGQTGKKRTIVIPAIPFVPWVCQKHELID
jgi:hypothetical protein